MKEYGESGIREWRRVIIENNRRGEVRGILIVGENSMEYLVNEEWKLKNMEVLLLIDLFDLPLQLMKAAVPAKSYVIHLSSASLVSCDVYGQ